MTAPDTFERISLLFCRLLHRDSTERPGFMVEPLRGSDWGAAVYLGKTPKPLWDHYARNSGVLGRDPGEAYRAVVAASAAGALAELERVLREALYLRLNADLAVWEVATGAAWPGVKPVVRVEARPHEPDPNDEAATWNRKILPSGR